MLVQSRQCHPTQFQDSWWIYPPWKLASKSWFRGGWCISVYYYIFLNLGKRPPLCSFLGLWRGCRIRLALASAGRCTQCQRLLTKRAPSARGTAPHRCVLEDLETPLMLMMLRLYYILYLNEIVCPKPWISVNKMSILCFFALAVFLELLFSLSKKLLFDPYINVLFVSVSL